MDNSQSSGSQNPFHLIAPQSLIKEAFLPGNSHAKDEGKHEEQRMNTCCLLRKVHAVTEQGLISYLPCAELLATWIYSWVVIWLAKLHILFKSESVVMDVGTQQAVSVILTQKKAPCIFWILIKHKSCNFNKYFFQTLSLKYNICTQMYIYHIQCIFTNGTYLCSQHPDQEIEYSIIIEAFLTLSSSHHSLKESLSFFLIWLYFAQHYVYRIHPHCSFSLLFGTECFVHPTLMGLWIPSTFGLLQIVLLLTS